MEPNEEFTRGLALRRQMFGEAGAEQQIASATEFTQPLQEWVTRVCFGELWHRPGLDFRMRSIITIAMLAALNRPNQVKIHVQGALENGVTVEEIREILLHAALYAGVPAAVESFVAASDVLAGASTK